MIYHFHLHDVKRADGSSAVQSLAYVLKEKDRDRSIEKNFDYSKGAGEIKARGFVQPDAMHFADAEECFNSIEAFEKRVDARPATRIDFALPREFSREQQIALAEDWAESLRRDGQAVAWALHDKDSSNPHVDALVTNRAWDPMRDTWGKKSKLVIKDGKQYNVQFFQGRDYVKKRRREFCELLNKHIARDLPATGDLRYYVSDRTLKEQHKLVNKVAEQLEQRGAATSQVAAIREYAEKLDRLPQIHVGAHNRAGASDRELFNEAIKAVNRERQAARRRQPAVTARQRHDEYWRKRQRDAQERQRAARARSNRSKRYGIGDDAQSRRSYARAKTRGEERVTIYRTLQEAIDAHPSLHETCTQQLKAQYARAGHPHPLRPAQALARSRHQVTDAVYAVSQSAGKATLTAIRASASVLAAVGSIAGKVPVVGAPVQMMCGLPQQGISAAERTASNLTKLAHGQQSVGQTLQALGKEGKDLVKQPLQAARSSGKELWSAAGHAARQADHAQPGKIPQIMQDAADQINYDAMRGAGLIAEQERARARAKWLRESI